jgi:hypothetical protein
MTGRPRTGRQSNSARNRSVAATSQSVQYVNYQGNYSGTGNFERGDRKFHQRLRCGSSPDGYVLAMECTANPAIRSPGIARGFFLQEAGFSPRLATSRSIAFWMVGTIWLVAILADVFAAHPMK